MFLALFISPVLFAHLFLGGGRVVLKVGEAEFWGALAIVGVIFLVGIRCWAWLGKKDSSR